MVSTRRSSFSVTSAQIMDTNTSTRASKRRQSLNFFHDSTSINQMNPLDFPTPPSVCKKKSSVFRDVSNAMNNTAAGISGDEKNQGKKSNRRVSARFVVSVSGPMMSKGEEDCAVQVDHDLENRPSYDDNFSYDVCSDDYKPVNASKRRKSERRSSIYVSSTDSNPKSMDSENGESLQDASASRNKRRQSIILPSQSNYLSEVMENDVSNLARKNKRKSRRQSIQLKKTSENTSLHEMINDCKDEREVSSNLNGNNSEKIFNLSTENNSLLIEAVREFSKLPVKERANSSALKVINELSNYPINSWKGCGGVIQHKSGGLDLNWSSSPRQTSELSTNSQKRALLKKFIPDFERLELRKINEIAALEASTRCRASKKNGKYQYKEIESGKSVTVEEYERRYYRFLVDEREKRTQDVRSETLHKKICLTPSISPIIVQSRRDKANNISSNFDDEKLCENTDMDISVIEDEKLNLCSEMDEDRCKSSNIWDNSKKLSCEETLDSRSCKIKTEIEGNDKIMKGTSILSSLQRDGLVQASMDPDELYVEQQLHRDIDAALERYSHKIIMLRRKRQKEQNKNDTILG